MKLLNKYERLAEKYNELDSDLERINFLKKNKDWFKVILGDVDAKVEFNNQSFEEDERSLIERIELNVFEFFYGIDAGTRILFSSHGIEVETI